MTVGTMAVRTIIAAQRKLSSAASILALAMVCFYSASALARNPLDGVVERANSEAGITTAAMPVVGDHIFLRRIYVDLIGRIPTEAEIREFASWPADGRREQLIDKLLADPRFADRWTMFYADMLRIRTDASGGAALIAYVHNALSTGMPYDQMAKRLIYTNGKAGRTPEAGFILGDDADPLAMASITSQVFLGVRIGCAQCHDHPFDVWTRRDFYDMAAYFGRTRRFESGLTRVVYATETEQTSIMWPPEGEAEMKDRKPLEPRFPFQMIDFSGKPQFVARLEAVRAAKEAAKPKPMGPSVDDLLEDSSSKIASATRGTLGEEFATKEAKTDIRKIDVQAGLYAPSDLRMQLAEQITDPRNRYFSRALVNRVWKTMVGRGFVEPVDDFREDNPAAHPAALDYLAEEFVASDYDLRTLVRMIATSDAYQRGHAPQDIEELTRMELEAALLSTPVRRMLAESLYDSIVTAGHLFTPKHSPGRNQRTITEVVRTPKPKTGEPAKPAAQLLAGNNNPAMAAPGMAGMSGPMAMQPDGSYGLESAIELDFTKLLAEQDEPEVAIEAMTAMSKEELEAQRMAMERMNRGGGGMEYDEKIVKRVIDENPVFSTSLRMQSPAPDGHFLRVFGQPNRSDLGDLRDDGASMRQALMMLNGRITHEAARVGDLEPMYKLLRGKDQNVDAAIKLAYLEILTRRPSEVELTEGREMITSAPTVEDGMADLRWILINCNEFRFLP